MKHRILLVGGQKIYQEALRFSLKDHAHLDLLGQASDSLQAIAMAQELAVDIVCIDLQTPGMGGIELTRALRHAMPGVKILSIAAHAAQFDVLDMLGAGANAVVTQTESGEEFLRAVRALLSGQSYLSPDVANVVASAWMADKLRSKAQGLLSERERQVLKLMATGHTSNEIAKLIWIAASTVEVHKRNIKRKLDRHNVADLTRYVMTKERGEPRFGGFLPPFCVLHPQDPSRSTAISQSEQNPE